MKRILLAAIILMQLGWTSEINVVDNRLKIVCPKCHAILYQCNIDEIHTYDVPTPDMCKPVNESLPEFKVGSNIFCPFDGISPTTQGIEGGISIFTNKGWMPRRE